MSCGPTTTSGRKPALRLLLPLPCHRFTVAMFGLKFGRDVSFPTPCASLWASVRYILSRRKRYSKESMVPCIYLTDLHPRQ